MQDGIYVYTNQTKTCLTLNVYISNTTSVRLQKYIGLTDYCTQQAGVIKIYHKNQIHVSAFNCLQPYHEFL